MRITPQRVAALPPVQAVAPLRVARPAPIVTPAVAEEAPHTGVLAWVARAAETVARAVAFLFALVFRPRLDGTGGVSPATSGNALKLLVDGDELKPALLAEIARARSTIWINVFEFQDEATATEIADALIAARARGVDVKLVIDNRKTIDEITAGAPKNTQLERLARSGIAVRYVDHAGFSVNHRKLMVFDGKSAIVTGANIGGNYLLPQKEGWTYHDAAVRVEGPAVYDVARVFAESWQQAGGAPLSLPTRAAPIATSPAGTVEVLSHSARHDRNIEREIVRGIDGEKKRVVLINGFGMSDAIREALLRARRRGVDVTWVFGAASRQATLMAQNSFGELAKAGVKIVAHPRPLHMKAYAFGDDTVLVGSANLDGFSGLMNDEAMLRIRSRDFMATFRSRVIDPDVRGAGPVTERPPASFGERLIQSVLEPAVD